MLLLDCVALLLLNSVAHLKHRSVMTFIRRNHVCSYLLVHCILDSGALLFVHCIALLFVDSVALLFLDCVALLLLHSVTLLFIDRLVASFALLFIDCVALLLLDRVANLTEVIS